MAGLDYLREVLWIAGGFAVVVAFLFLFALYRQVTKPAPRAQTGATPNLTEAAILFQTLRGIIHDQKNLAKEFNASFDKKVAFVREFMTKAANEIGTLQAELKDLATRVETAKADLESLRAEAAARRTEPGARHEPAFRDREPDFIVHASGRPAQSGVPRGAVAKSEPPPLHVVAKPDTADDFITSWSGFEFGDLEDQDEFEVPETPPEEPGDPETAREAFRTLLNIQPDTGKASKIDFAAAALALPREPERTNPASGPDNGNGRDKGAPLRGRVYEYYDAGMTVSEISRELGIGKGEVRLMLNLRDRSERLA